MSPASEDSATEFPFRHHRAVMGALIAFGLMVAGGGQFALGALALALGSVIAFIRPVPAGYEWTRLAGSGLLGVVVVLLVIAIFHPVTPFYHIGSGDWLAGQYGVEQDRRLAKPGP